MTSKLLPLFLLAGCLAGLLAQSGTMFPPVRGMHEMVAAANNFEVEAGFRILTQGGNAVDAGVASVLAAQVLFGPLLYALSKIIWANLFYKYQGPAVPAGRTGR